MELQSAEIKDLVTALVKVQSVIRDAEKNAKNPHFKNDYANLEAVIAATREPFAANGLVVTQLPSVFDGKPVLVTMLMHTTGQWIKCYTPIINTKGDAQGMGSALTYARRYSLSALAGISQTDDDGEAASQAPTPRPSGKPGPIATKPQTALETYRVPSGIYKGKALDEIDADELANHVANIEAEHKKRGKLLGGDVLTFVAMAQKYLGNQPF